MIRTASPADLPALRTLFAGANDTPYDLARVAEEKCFGEGIAGAPVTRVFARGERIVAAAVTCGKWLRILAVDREHRRQGIGTALLSDSRATVIAAEPGNYFVPGVPEGETFFARRGYRQTAQTWNLEVDLGAFDVHATRATDRERTLAFIEREFGRIWRFEAAKAPTIFIEEHDGEIAGFAAHDANNRGLGFFGPTGVRKDLRGRGIGCRLLLASLTDLQRLGHRKAVIPWTDALEFYVKCCGAKPVHRFATYAI